MESAPHPGRLVAWVRAIAVLAMDADQQGAWLDSLGPVASWNVDELGLEFGDGHILMDQWVAAGWVAPASVPSLIALSDLLDKMSGEANATLWTREALADHQAWREVRALAMSVLITFN